MTELIACLSPDRDMWGHVARLINDREWDNIFLIADDAGKTNFRVDKKAEFVVVDFKRPVFELIEDIKSSLKEKIKGIEVAVNIVSGNGKQHTAIMSALLKLGLGIRFVAVTREGVKEI